jgi:putative Mg2+ transporter-C (MgtC) family protein
MMAMTNGRGVNPAATIGCAVAAGTLAGAGFCPHAFCGAAAVVSYIALRPLGRLLDRQPGSTEEIVTTRDLRAITRSKQEAHIRLLIVRSALGERPVQRIRALALPFTADARVLTCCLLTRVPLKNPHDRVRTG